MEYIYHYNSPLGGITMCSDGQALTGLLFDGEKYFTETFSAETAGITECEDSNLPAFAETVRWLDIYFGGKGPGFLPPIALIIPCHRVIGTDGSLTGYAGGIDKKAKLLQLEGVEIQED